MWSSVWAVLRREYLQRVRSKFFIAATLGGPALMAALFVLPVYFSNRGEVAERTLAVVDGTDVLYERVAPELESSGWTVSEQRWYADVATELRERVELGEIGGYIMLDELTLETGEAALYARRRPSPIRLFTIESSISRAALEYQLEQAGVDAEAMLDGGDLRVELLSQSATDSRGGFAIAYLGAMALYMVLLIYAVSVMRATLEEKTSRVVEIIVSSIEPWHLMLGKIVGVGAVGLTQMAVWITAGALLIATGLPMLIAARPELANLAEISDVLPGAGIFAVFVGFFLCGYFMYSGLYAAVGAMCNTDEEAQQAQLPLVLLQVAPIVLIMGVIRDPLSPLSTGLSLFPLFTPILMWARVASGVVPVWQVGLSFVLMVLAILAIAWIAGRIYKVGILMAGKRPTLPELWRWVREA